ncbi:aspartate aminotransferase family protein, partial [Pseudomonas aeruginosa]
MNARLHATSPLGDAVLVRADQAHYMHGYHVFDVLRVNGSLKMAAGDGAYFYDTAGNRFLDGVGGM